MNPVDPRPNDAEQDRAWLSELMDGQARACQPAVEAWLRDAEARRSWHAYQLIGDVLRSEDLAVPAGHDEAFLLRFRARLAQEPVVLAPTPTLPSVGETREAWNPRRPGLVWSAAAAVAGVALVVGAVFSLQRGSNAELALDTAVQRDPAGSVPAPQAATAQGGSPRLVNSLPNGTTPPVAAEAQIQQWNMLDPLLLRDTHLESYLRVHRGTTAFGGRVEPVALER